MKGKKIFYVIDYAFDKDRICSKQFNVESKRYKQFFKEWYFHPFVTGYLCDESGNLLAASTSYTIFRDPQSYDNYMLMSSLVQLGFSKEYKAFVYIKCKANDYYIGFNDENLDIYEVIDEKLILITKNIKK